MVVAFLGRRAEQTPRGLRHERQGMRVDVRKGRTPANEMSSLKARERDQPFLPEPLSFEEARVDDVRKEEM